MTVREALTSRLRRWLDERLSPSYLRVVAWLVLGGTAAVTVTLFATADGGVTVFGTPLGYDFAGFVAAARLVERDHGASLYDFSLHNQLYHELLPNLDRRTALPYVHPPLVAALMQPLARLPYSGAVGLWLVLSLAAFVLGMLVLLRSLPELSHGKRAGLALLLALSAEPFAMECWLGGQLSVVGFLGYALAWSALTQRRPFAAGAALGLCFYKPTLLLLIVPLLVIGRRVRVLSGMAVTLAALTGLSIALAGWETCIHYLDVLVSFHRQSDSGALPIITWKYVDLNNALHLSLGGHGAARMALLAALSLLPLVSLTKWWWRWQRLRDDQRQWLWSATLAWLPLLNLYVGIYDSVLVLQSLFIAADALLRTQRGPTPLLRSGFAYWAAAVAVAAWITQPLARVIHVQVYTLLLFGFGCFLLRQLHVSEAAQRVGRGC